MDVMALLSSGSGEQIRDAIVQLAHRKDAESLKVLQDLLRHRDSHTFFKHAVPHLASLALLAHGVEGVRALRRVFEEAPGAIYPTAILGTLWAVATEQPLDAFQLKYLPPAPELQILPAPEVRAAAIRALREIVADSMVDEDMFFTVLNFVFQKGIGLSMEGDTSPEWRRKLLHLLTEATLKISSSLLAEFKDMIDRDCNEEAYHEFLGANPVFLDPLARVASRHKLGLELVTDFVVRRYDDKYLLVEIEKPQDRIFTQANDFSAQFSHALGQILDFQAWVEDNGAYARSLIPEIASPRGLLVMGRKSDFSEAQRRKLHRLNVNMASVDVVTFEELHESAARLYENLYHATEVPSGCV
ncbi:MAG: Shedu anti-phage system protein SduA domain-containing protein [Gammaproteobacteria bacterium]